MLKKLFLLSVSIYLTSRPLLLDMYELQYRKTAAVPSVMQMLLATGKKYFYGAQGIRQVSIKKKIVALTFDDGPHGTNTPLLLDLFKDRKIPATFFVTGRCVARYPFILERALQEGHEIGNHSWDHPQLPKVDSTELHHQIADTNGLIQSIMRRKITLMRMPYGITNPLLSWYVQHNYGMKIINWSVDPMDWKKPGVFLLLHRILKTVKPGSILLFHDIHKETVQAMPAILDTLSAEGYEFVTVSQLLNMRDTKHRKNNPKRSLDTIPSA